VELVQRCFPRVGGRLWSPSGAGREPGQRPGWTPPNKYGAKYNKAVTCQTKDREALLAFFDFPAEHWDHLRTSNPIESVFATVRHRTVRTKGALSATTAKLMVFKLVIAAAKTWRRLKGENQLPKVVRGVKFQNGIEVIAMPTHHAA
jgi:putative transposase